MRFIITSAQSVEKLKQQAKKLKRKHGIPHAEALDKAAKQHNYNHWGHVTWCAKETLTLERPLSESCAEVVKNAQAGKHDMYVLENDGPSPLLLFSTERGDAWLLDPFKRYGLCLCWHSEAQPYSFRQSGRAMEIPWDTHYTTTEDYQFSIKSTNPKVGTCIVDGYPIDLIEEMERQKFSPDVRQIMLREGAEPITDELVEELVQRGWSRELVEQYRSQGMDYSRPRNTFLGPILTDEDFPENDEAEVEDASQVSGKDAFIQATGGFKIGQSMAELESNEREKSALLAKLKKGKATPADIARLEDLLGVDEDD